MVEGGGSVSMCTKAVQEALGSNARVQSLLQPMRARGLAVAVECRDSEHQEKEAAEPATNADAEATEEQKRIRYHRREEQRKAEQLQQQERAKANARGWTQSNPLKIVLLANLLPRKADVLETLVHELVHVSDFFVSGIDPFNCKGLAFSEIRAARAAECHEDFNPSLCSWFQHRCIRSVATRSTRNLFPDLGEWCVNKEFADAMRSPESGIPPTDVDPALRANSS